MIHDTRNIILIRFNDCVANMVYRCNNKMYKVVTLLDFVNFILKSNMEKRITILYTVHYLKTIQFNTHFELTIIHDIYMIVGGDHSQCCVVGGRTRRCTYIYKVNVLRTVCYAVLAT